MASTIRVKTFLSPQYEEMYNQFFLPSLLRVEPDVKLEKYEFNIGGDGEFGSSDFKMAACIKWKKILEWLNDDDIPFVFCDADILFIKPFLAQIEADSDGVDISLQEGYTATWGNVGVMYIRSTAATRQFAADVLEQSIITKKWDERIANRLLLENRFPFKILSRRYCTNYYSHDDPLLFHAVPTFATNPTPCIQQKIKLMSTLKQKLGF